MQTRKHASAQAQAQAYPPPRLLLCPTVQAHASLLTARGLKHTHNGHGRPFLTANLLPAGCKFGAVLQIVRIRLPSTKSTDWHLLRVAGDGGDDDDDGNGRAYPERLAAFSGPSRGRVISADVGRVRTPVRGPSQTAAGTGSSGASGMAARDNQTGNTTVA